MRLYPALVLAYVCGIAVVLAGRYDTLSMLLASRKIRKGNGRAPLLRVLSQPDVIDADLMRKLPGLDRHKTPVSVHLYDLLKEPLSEFAIDETEFREAFDRFEYLSALVHGDFYEKEGSTRIVWSPMGCFLWRHGILEDIDAEIKERGQDWPLLKAGLFDGSLDRLLFVKAQIDQIVRKSQWC